MKRVVYSTSSQYEDQDIYADIDYRQLTQESKIETIKFKTPDKILKMGSIKTIRF